MKKIVILLSLMVLSSPVLAQYHGHHHYGYWRHAGGPSPWVWVAPTIVGGVIGYEIARNQPPVVVQQPVIVQQTPVPPATVYYGQTQTCTVWTEVQQPDGTITRTRTCSQ
jgi:hypothetical protein